MFGNRGNQGIVDLLNRILQREVARYEEEDGWMEKEKKGEVLGLVGYRSKYEEENDDDNDNDNESVVLEGVSQFIAVDDGDGDGSGHGVYNKQSDSGGGNKSTNRISGSECKCRCKCNQQQQRDTMNELRKSVVQNHKPKLGVQSISHSHSNIISMNFNQIHNKRKQSKTTLKRSSCAPFFHFGVANADKQRVVVTQPDHTNTNTKQHAQLTSTSTSVQPRQWFNLQNIKSSSVILPKRVSKSKAFQMYYCVDKAYTPELKAKYPKYPVMSKVSRNHVNCNNDVVATTSNVLTSDKVMCEESNVESSNIHSSTSSSFILEQSKESEREQQREEKRNVERFYYKVGSHYHDKELMMVVNNTRLARRRGEDDDNNEKERFHLVRRRVSNDRSYSSGDSRSKRKKTKMNKGNYGYQKYKEKEMRKISIPKRKKQPCIDLVSEDLMNQYSNIITIY